MARALVSLIVLVLTVPAAFAVEGGERGRWEYLGEDGAIWVPAEPDLSAAYLPPEHLGAFHNHSEMTAALQALAAAHPDLVTLESLGLSVEGREVWALTLRAGSDDGRPAVLFDGAHHGDEVIASEILVRYAQTLVQEYPDTPRSREILENATLVIVPMVNPDGLSRSHNSTNYADARKNARGVDLNRNYAATWGGTGSSGSPGSATYRGPTPASEPETQHMQALLASRNWTFYSSLHSGAEMILWPYGHTTVRPEEHAVYERLGDELSAITTAPNGQVSHILYSVSGDSMDHAYLGAGPYWRPLSTSPETYEGSGNAFDWWYLFNPLDADIPSVVARWTGFLDHLAKEAVHYAPATLTPPSGHTGPGAPFALDASVTTPLKRPFVQASAALDAPSFLDVATPNPIAIGALNGTRAFGWTLEPTSGGAGEASLALDAGPAGKLRASFPIVITAPALDLNVAPATLGSGQAFVATLTATSDTPLIGTATLVWENATVDTREVALDGTGAAAWTVLVNVTDAPAGARPVVARLDYTTIDGPGSVGMTKSVFVDRPQLVATRSGVPDPASAGSGFVEIVMVRNVGTRAAYNTTITETLPLGHSLWLRQASTLDPIVRPAPDLVTVDETGRMVLQWDAGLLAARGNFRIEIGLMPALPGAHALTTQFAYEAQYASGGYAYSGEHATEYEVVAPIP